MARNNKILTADGVPLEELMQYGNDLTDQFEATTDRRFQSLLGQEVNQRVFQRRLGDISWNKVAEGEKPRTGTLNSESMAFTIDEYNAGLGWNRNYIEDNPQDLLEREMEALMEGAEERVFEETFNVFKNGIADGTEVHWTTPPSPGTRDFAGDHDHSFGTTGELFDDTNAHSASEHIARSNVELQHHKYDPDVAFVSPDFAWKLLTEQNDSYNFQIREARDLLNTPLPEIQFNIGGTRVVQTAELSGDTFYVFDSSLDPLYYNWVRPVEVTQENGAPVQDPTQLIGAIGSARFGIKMVNPWAGVKVTPDNIA
jgi:hypothetical protein